MSLKVTLYRQKEKVKRSIQRMSGGCCTVLLYHRVIDLKYDPQQLCVSPQRFSEQLSFLKKTYTFLSIDEFHEILNNNKAFPKKSLLMTFDDGYADNYYNALPILEHLNLPAVFYISTKNINTDELMWWDELDLIFQKKKNISTLLKKYNLTNEESLYKHYLVKCKTAASLDERNGLLNEVRSIVELTTAEKQNHKFLSTQELKKLGSSKLVTIGAHTVNHLSLAHINEADKKLEIKNSVKTLSLLGSKIEHFSFPYGEKTNYDEKSIKICKELGLKSSSANYLGYVTKGSDLFSFPRFVVRNDSPEVVLQKMKAIL